MRDITEYRQRCLRKAWYDFQSACNLETANWFRHLKFFTLSAPDHHRCLYFPPQLDKWNWEKLLYTHDPHAGKLLWKSIMQRHTPHIHFVGQAMFSRLLTLYITSTSFRTRVFVMFELVSVLVCFCNASQRGIYCTMAVSVRHDLVSKWWASARIISPRRLIDLLTLFHMSTALCLYGRSLWATASPFAHRWYCGIRISHALNALAKYGVVRSQWDICVDVTTHRTFL